MYPLNKAFGAKDAGPNGENGVTSNVDFATGPDGKDNVTVINVSKIAFIFPRQVIGLFKSRATLSTNVAEHLKTYLTPLVLVESNFPTSRLLHMILCACVRYYDWKSKR